MTTISIQVKDRIFAAQLIQKYQRHKNVAHISIVDSFSGESDALPAKPMGIKTFLKKIFDAEKTTGVPWENVKKELNKK